MLAIFGVKIPPLVRAILIAAPFVCICIAAYLVFRDRSR